MSCLRVSPKPTRYGEKLLGFGCPITKNYIKDLFLAHICYVYTLKQLSYSWKNYMKEYVEAIRGQIFISQGPHIRLFVAKYAESSIRL